MPYQLVLAERVENFLGNMDKGEREKIIKRLELLKDNPQSVGEPRGKFWVLKVGRAGYRLAFRIIEEEMVITSSLYTHG